MKKIAFLCMAVLALFTACEKTVLTVSNSTVILNVNEEFQVKALVGADEVAATWTTADATVATVEAGLIKAVGVGETTVTAAYEGQTAIVEVIVEQLVEDQPAVEAPGEGKVTILVQVPEPLCEGSFVVIPGSLTSWNPGDAVANGQATQLVEGTQTWYACTFNWEVDRAFKVAHCKNDGTWEWSFQALNGTLIEGDVTLGNDGNINGDNVINSGNQVIVVSVESWELSACVKTNDAGTATFNLTAVGFAPEAKFAIAGSGLAAGAWACPPPAEHEMTKVAEGKYTLTLDVPATFQYKYLVDKAGDGNWEWFSAANYNMPVSLETNDTETLPEETPAE